MKYALAVALIALIALAAADTTYPQLRAYVNDYAGMLDASCVNELDAMCAGIEKNTTAEIAIVTMGSLNGLSLEDYSIKLFRANGIGQKEKNNGLMILAFVQDRRFRIETGYGLEGLLPDAALLQITNDELVPAFQNASYCEGFKKTIAIIGNAIVSDTPIKPKEEGIVLDDNAKMWIVIAIVVLILILALGGGDLLLIPIGLGGGGGGSGGFGGGSGGGGGLSGKW